MLVLSHESEKQTYNTLFLYAGFISGKYDTLFAKPIKPASPALKDSPQDTQQKVDQLLAQLTPKEESALEKKLKIQRKVDRWSDVINLYRPNYILPFYYTGSPYYAAYAGRTPADQRLKKAEFKGQLSLLFTPVPQLFHNPKLSLNVAYTQLMYWQFYAKSQYFREINYEPEVFLGYHFYRNWLFNIGVNHQSNGQGGAAERSWNRLIASLQFAGGNWMVNVRPWLLIFKNESSRLHNPDIAHYLGYENVLFSYNFHHLVISLELQNLESGLKRGFIMTTISYPITRHISVYGQYFNGYGQSLIEYNHRTQSAGIGIALNNWIG